MMPAAVTILALPSLVLALLAARRMSPIARANLGGIALLVVFSVLAQPAHGRAFDHLVGIAGLGRLIYQTALVVAMLLWLTTMARYNPILWPLWRRTVMLALPLLAVAEVSWGLVHTVAIADPAPLYYDGLQAHPWSVCLMNLGLGLADLSVAGGLVIGHVRSLSAWPRDVGRGLGIALLVHWGIVAVPPALLVLGVILTLGGSSPWRVMPAAASAASLALVMSGAIKGWIALSTWIPRCLVRWQERRRVRLTRTLTHATERLRAQLPRTAVSSPTLSDTTAIRQRVAGAVAPVALAAWDRRQGSAARGLHSRLARERWRLAREQARAAVGLLDVRDPLVRHCDRAAVGVVAARCRVLSLSVHHSQVAREVARWLSVDPDNPLVPAGPDLALLDASGDDRAAVGAWTWQADAILADAWVVYALITGQDHQRRWRRRLLTIEPWHRDVADVITAALDEEMGAVEATGTDYPGQVR